jgi:hypothetical protein
MQNPTTIIESEDLHQFPATSHKGMDIQ